MCAAREQWGFPVSARPLVFRFGRVGWCRGWCQLECLEQFNVTFSSVVVTGLAAYTSGGRQEFSPRPHMVSQAQCHRRRAPVVDAADGGHRLA
jgi:hypothetical protein